MARKRVTPADKWDAAESWDEAFEQLFPNNSAARAAAARRKLRLLVCAAARFVWDLMTDEPCRLAVETAERVADGLAPTTKLRAARAGANKVAVAAERECDARMREHWKRVAAAQAAQPGVWVPRGLDLAALFRRKAAAELSRTATEPDLGCDLVGGPVYHLGHLALPLEDYVRVTDTPYDGWDCPDPPDPGPGLLRDLFGNPFRPVVWDRRWATRTACGLADAMTAAGAFDRLPILADALEEAGCNDPAILAHCRADRPHYRGCWVVDLVHGVHWAPRPKR